MKPKDRDELIEQLQVVIREDILPDLHQAVLLQLLASCNLRRLIFHDREGARIFRKKIKAFRQDESILGDVKKAAVAAEAITGT